LGQVLVTVVYGVHIRGLIRQVGLDDIAAVKFGDFRKFKQAHAALGRTAFFEDVSLIFIPKVSERGEDRLGAGLAQTAEGGVFNLPAQFFKGREVFRLAATLSAQRALIS